MGSLNCMIPCIPKAMSSRVILVLHNLTLSHKVDNRNCTSSLSNPMALSCIREAEDDKPWRPNKALPISEGVKITADADTFLANCPASSCTSGTFDVIPCRPKIESAIAVEVILVLSDSDILLANCFMRNRTSTVSGPNRCNPSIALAMCCDNMTAFDRFNFSANLPAINLASTMSEDRPCSPYKALPISWESNLPEVASILSAKALNRDRSSGQSRFMPERP
mmetsp:Transcript_9646/g.9442  ORF Transcript_9646/g.9442 Transcript_9646/m.9442 type:complete len:223 (+) Transcript_9646:1159-1827(+)